MTSNTYIQENPLLGESNAFLATLEHVSRVAPLNKPILVIGERGTGKELIAARIHYLSKRWNEAFIKMNCATINENLLESELFGHEAGSYTGANRRRIGRFEMADNGTLLLDELATISARVQESLLRVIEYGEFERVGGNQPVNVNTRIIAATNEDLPTLAEQGRFREDLLDRLAFDVITIPPLRARQDDILSLATHFAIGMTKELEREYFPGFTEEANAALLNYPWPGNVRELKNVVERSIYRNQAPEQAITHFDFHPFASPFRPINSYKPKQSNLSQASASLPIKQASPLAEDKTASELVNGMQYPIDLKTHIQDYEINLIKRALKDSHFNQKKTADLLGLSYHQLRGYLKKYDLINPD